MLAPNHLLLILAAASFISAFSIQMISPLVPAIARDFGVAIETAALLATAFTFTYALSQPILGPIGDAFGKAIVIKCCLAVMAASMILAAFATRFEHLFAARMLAGVAGGGVIPVAFAIIGDRFPMAERQVAISRLVMASQTAILLGSAVGGLIAATYSWRWMFIVPSAVAVCVLGLAVIFLKPRAGAPRSPFNVAYIKANYRQAFASPFAPICLVGAFVGGAILFGLMPFIAGRIEQLGQGGLGESGMVIASVAVGGFVFTLLVSRLLRLLGRAGLVRVGGAMVSVALAGIALAGTWQLQAALFAVVGMGFFMVHNTMQALATELVPTARGASISLFAFILFLGQAIGPIVYGLAFRAFGQVTPILAAALVYAVLAWWLARRLNAQAAASVTQNP